MVGVRAIILSFVVVLFWSSRSMANEGVIVFDCSFSMDNSINADIIDEIKKLRVPMVLAYKSTKLESFNQEVPVGMNGLYKKVKFYKESGMVKNDAAPEGTKPAPARVTAGEIVVVFEYSNGGLINVIRVFNDPIVKTAIWLDSDSGIVMEGICK